MHLVLLGVDVSIHAPGRGATLPPPPPGVVITGFNSRTREGCDKIYYDFYRRQDYVSIHAPGRGATTANSNDNNDNNGFNSRTREGCDRSAGWILTEKTKFQFTHPGGVRLTKRFVYFS